MKFFRQYIVGLFLLTAFLQAGCSQDEAAEAGIAAYLNQDVDLSRETYPAEELGKWVQTPGNGCIKTKTIGEVSFQLLRKPIDYMICSENNFLPMDEATYRSKLKALGGLEYFDMRIALKDRNGDLLKHISGNYSEYDALVKYYSFKAEQDIKLVCDADTVKCAMLHFERTYGSVPYLSFVIAFEQNEKVKRAKDLTFILRDRVFDKGIIKFNYSRIELNNIPKLKV